jgi:hypothetical protein
MRLDEVSSKRLCHPTSLLNMDLPARFFVPWETLLWGLPDLPSSPNAPPRFPPWIWNLAPGPRLATQCWKDKALVTPDTNACCKALGGFKASSLGHPATMSLRDILFALLERSPPRPQLPHSFDRFGGKSLR